MTSYPSERNKIFGCVIAVQTTRCIFASFFCLTDERIITSNPMTMTYLAASGSGMILEGASLISPSHVAFRAKLVLLLFILDKWIFDASPAIFHYGSVFGGFQIPRLFLTTFTILYLRMNSMTHDMWLLFMRCLVTLCSNTSTCSILTEEFWGAAYNGNRA